MPEMGHSENKCNYKKIGGFVLESLIRMLIKKAVLRAMKKFY